VILKLINQHNNRPLMKISYITQATGNIEVLSQIETAPKKLGTVGEHLAYAISTTLKSAKKARAEYQLDADLNRELKNIFASCMNEAVATIRCVCPAG
jgi:hypothetical protein